MKRCFRKNRLKSYLATGTIALTLTGCGGGGGGGGSNNSSTGTPSVSLDKNNETHIVENSNLSITGTINGNTTGLTGIKALNSNVESNATISLSGDGTIGIHGTTSNPITKSNHTITNNGNINITGHNSIGILVDNGVTGINKGNINLTSGFKDEPYTETETNTNLGGTYINETIFDKKIDFLVGLKADEGSTVINEKNINLTGHGAGIQANNNSTGINKGSINLTSNKNFVIENFYNNDVLSSIEKYDNYLDVSGLMGKNYATLTNEGNISIKGSGTGIDFQNNSEGTNNGTINLESIKYTAELSFPNDSIDPHIHIDFTSVSGLEGKYNSVATNNKNIYLKGEGEGIAVEFDSKGFNNGNILGESIQYEDSYDNGSEIVKEIRESYIIGMDAAENSSIENTGTISIKGSGTGMEVDGKSQGINKGSIFLSGHSVNGTFLEDSGSFINDKNGVIEVLTTKYEAIGMSLYNYAYEVDDVGPATIENHGSIKASSSPELDGTSGATYNRIFGIYAISGSNTDVPTPTVEVLNTGTIEVKGSKATGIYGSGDKQTITNKGVITANGNFARGIYSSGHNSTATNLGTINIEGENSYGMYAANGSTVINGKEGDLSSGVINVAASASGAMFAEGISTAINYGTINIAVGNNNSNTTINDSEGNSVSAAALNASNGGIIKNFGKINTDADLTIVSSQGGAYVVGTSENGSYGQISGKNISLDGTVKVDTSITKNGFKDSYTLENIVSGDTVSLGKEFTFKSNSLLYDATANKDTWGNLDGTLTRNDKNLSDFTTGHLSHTANIFGQYFSENDFNTLSADAQDVIKYIDTESSASIKNSLDRLKPTIYSNLGRQISNIGDTFKNQEFLTINSIENNNYTFTLLGNYEDIDSRKNIPGYKSTISGFLGAMNFGNNTFGSIGYGYSDIDYTGKSKGSIESIHLGLNKFMKYNDFNINFGLGGEYNFHKNTRTIETSSLERDCKSDFDSYNILFNGEISQTFGYEFYIKPYANLDLAYSKYESFSEKNGNSLNVSMDSQDYTSILPKIGLELGTTYSNLNLFVKTNYSYELGNMDKKQSFVYEGFQGKDFLPEDTLETYTVEVKGGISYSLNHFTFQGEIGKNIGKRDNTFGRASLSYTF